MTVGLLAQFPQLNLNMYNACNYNIVGMAVTMVISILHEKSCIASHNAWKFEKYSKTIHTSCNPNDEIVEVSLSRQQVKLS